MESLVWLAIPGLILFWLFLPRKAREKSSSDSKKYRTSGAVLFGINEVFAPSAANATIIQEEQRQSRRAIPAPEDKLL
jgi:hypothetical protein